MYCSNCGNQLPENAVICLQCGCAVDNAAFNNRNFGHNHNQHADPQNCPDSSSFAPKSPKEGVVVLVLMLLFGFLGVYRMYVGKVASGVGMALLFLLGYIPLAIWRVMAGFWVSDSYVGVRYHVGDLFFWPWFGWFSIAFLPLFVWWLIDLIALIKGDFSDYKGRKIKL